MSIDVASLAARLEPIMLVAMVAVFVLIALSLYWPGRRDTVEQPGQIPLKDDL